MYFSVIEPAAGRERAAAHDWNAGAYQQHQWLWRFLPAPRGAPRNFVFRRHDGTDLPRFYVVSEAQPTSPTPNWMARSKSYAPDLAVGDELEFELRANPVITTRGADGRSHRHDVVMQAKKRLLAERNLARWAQWLDPERPALPDLVRRAGSAWLLARAEKLGVDIDEDGLRVEAYNQHRGKSDELRFSTIDFRGRLRVVDPAALGRALTNGVGHGKAFGCGLLLVRPLG